MQLVFIKLVSKISDFINAHQKSNEIFAWLYILQNHNVRFPVLTFIEIHLVIRRRGAPGPSESGPTPRRLKEPSQGIPQVRRSTGSIPQKR